MKILLCGIAATVSLAWAASASATTIDMESLPAGSCAYVGPSVTTQGFTFATQTAGNGLFSCDGNVNSEDPTRSLVDANGPSDVLMTSADSSAFSLQSVGAATRAGDFDVGNPSIAQGSAGFTVTGFLVGGGTVSQTINFSDLSYNIYSLTGFNNLSGAEFAAFGFSDNPEIALDDITVNAGVPEPATWALMLIGLGVVGTSLRRSRVQIRVAAN